MTTRTNHLLAAFLRLPLDSDNEHICQGGRYMEERSELDKLNPVFPLFPTTPAPITLMTDREIDSTVRALVKRHSQITPLNATDRFLLRIFPHPHSCFQ